MHERPKRQRNSSSSVPPLLFHNPLISVTDTIASSLRDGNLWPIPPPPHFPCPVPYQVPLMFPYVPSSLSLPSPWCKCSAPRHRVQEPSASRDPSPILGPMSCKCRFRRRHSSLANISWSLIFHCQKDKLWLLPKQECSSIIPLGRFPWTLSLPPTGVLSGLT